MKKKILVFGGTGFVGSTFINYSKDLFEIFYTYNENPIDFDHISFKKINLLLERKKISSIINQFNPDVIINTVAFPSVDFCETNHDLANELHVCATKDIVDAASKNDSKVIYLSTDAVFEGELHRKYTETDSPKPVNYYGISKLNAEKIVLEKSNNVVLRTAVIYGWHIKSRFTNWILEYLAEDKTVDPFIDQFNTPTLVDDLAKGVFSNVGERGAQLSGGQRQRIGIARSLYSGAEILFFDEATSALDSETEMEITEAISKLTEGGLTIVIVAHRITTLRSCDKIIELENGSIVSSQSYSELRNNANA